MSVTNKLKILVDSVSMLSKLPIAELAENKKLIKEMAEIMNAKGIGSIVDDLRNERIAEKNEAFNARSKLQEPNLLNLYAQYKGAEFAQVSQSANHNYTEPVQFDSMRGAIAANAKTLSETKQAKDFASAFNSIYSSSSLQINTPNDPTILSSYLDYSPYLVNYIDYLGMPTLPRLVERPLDLAMKHAPEIETKDNALKELLEKVFLREHIYEILKQYMLFAALSPRGSLLVPILQNGRVRFNAFNDAEFSYGLGNAYRSIQRLFSISRVGEIFCYGSVLRDGVTCLFNCEGFEPAFAMGKNKIFQLREAASAINIYIYTIKVLCIRAQILIQKTDGEGQNDTLLSAMQSQLQQIASSLSLSTPIVQPQGNELDILNNNISQGFADVAPVLKDFTGLLSGISPDYFFGSSSTPYNGASFNIATSQENIHAELQRGQLLPAYRFIVNTFLKFDSRFEKWRDEEDDFEINFRSIYEESESEKADVAAKKIANIIQMRDYPELEETFKAEKLLPEKITFARLDDVDEKGQLPGDEVPDTDTSKQALSFAPRTPKT